MRASRNKIARVAVWLIVPALLLAMAAQPLFLRAQGQKPWFHDPEIHKEAMQSLRAGKLQEALDGFCKMLIMPKGRMLWTVSVQLLCNTEEINSLVSQIEAIGPVFVQRRVFEGKSCYRVCAGLTTNRQYAVAWIQKLPASIKAAGPFPVEVRYPCELAPAGESHGLPPPGKTGNKTGAPEEEQPKAAAPIQEVELAPVKVGAPAGEPPVSKGETKAPQGHYEMSHAVSPLAPPPLTTHLPIPSEPAPGKIYVPTATPEAESWFQKGLSAYNRGDKKEASRCYKESLAISPDKPEALNNLGILMLEEKRYIEAKKLCLKALAKSPGYSRAHLSLAGALWGLKDYKEAIEEAKAAVGLDTHDVSARLTLASFLRAVGREDEAVAEAKLVQLMEPGNASATAFLAAGPPKKSQIKKIKD